MEIFSNEFKAEIDFWRKKIVGIEFENLNSLISLLTILIGLIYCLMTVQMIAHRYQSFEFASMFVSDGPLITKSLLTMLEQNSTTVSNLFYYGNFFHFISFYMAKILMEVGAPLNFSTAALSLFIVQMISWTSVLYFTYRMGIIITKNIILSFSIAIVFVSTHGVFTWGYHIHPDIVQLALLTISAYLIITGSLKNIFIAAAIIGLATSTKYIGGFYTILIPLSYTSYFLLHYDREQSFKKTVGTYLRNSIALLLIWLLFIIIPTWRFVVEPSESLRQLMNMFIGASDGYGYVPPSDPFLWLPVFEKETNGYLWILPFSLLILVWYLWQNRHTLLSRVHEMIKTRYNLLIMFSFFITMGINAGFLLFFINERHPRHMLTLLPLFFAVIFYTYYIALKIDFFKKYRLSMILVITFFSALSAYNHFWGDNWRALQWITVSGKNSPKELAGNLVERHCNDDAVILVPYYSYVPRHDRFRKVFRHHFFEKSQINSSDVLVLNSSVPGRHIWYDEHGELQKGSLWDSDVQYDLFLNEVFESEDFELVFKEREVRVYQRVNSDFCDIPSNISKDLVSNN